MPDWPTIHAELKRKGVTRQLLWTEYKATAPDGYQYTQFCRHYHAWAGTIEPALRQVYMAGEKCFIDHTGLTSPDVATRLRARSASRAAHEFQSKLGSATRHALLRLPPCCHGR